MNLLGASAVELAQRIVRQAADWEEAHPDAVDLAVCPPTIYLRDVASALDGSRVALGAQNMYQAPEGAYTGEISGQMLQDVGCRYVILGHSERRHVLGESDQAVCQKVHQALTIPLIPIVCVGETLAEREADRTMDVVGNQLIRSLDGVTQQQMQGIVLAYEPVWAIGTGKVATPAQAEQVHADLRSLIESRYNAATAQAVRIQYGGSVKPSNAGDLLSQPNIDGVLVGGAALDADSFLGIVDAVGSKR